MDARRAQRMGSGLEVSGARETSARRRACLPRRRDGERRRTMSVCPVRRERAHAFVRSRVAAVGSCLLVLTTFVPPVGAAPAGRVDLAWSQGDPTCIGASDLIVTVERTLGRSVFHTDGPAAASVRGTIGRAGPG